LNESQLEELRWELSKVLTEDADLMIIQLCPRCAKRVVDSRGITEWKKDPVTFEIL